MIARNLHDDDFLAFIKHLRREVQQEIEEGKRDWELVRDAIELWELIKTKERYNAAIANVPTPKIEGFIADPNMITVTDLQQPSQIIIWANKLNDAGHLIQLSQTSPAPESDLSNSSSE